MRAWRVLLRPRRRLPVCALQSCAVDLRIFLTVAAALLILAAGCDDDPAASEEPRASADVTGTIAQVKTGAGVANLIVVLVRDGAVIDIAATDAAGRFSFDDVPNGDYRALITGLELTALSVPHTALEPPFHDFTVTGEPLDLQFATVGLIPPRILGFVTCSGRPAAGVAVRVLGGRDDVTVSTNEQGKYAATDLDTGHHIVILEAPPCGGSSMRTANLLPGQSVEVDFAQ